MNAALDVSPTYPRQLHRWDHLPLPTPARAATRIAVFGSFHGGFHVLNTLLTAFREEVRVVGVATDNPEHPFTNAAKRLWKYPHTRDEEVMVTRLAEENGLPVFTGRVKSEAFHRVFAQEWRPALCLMATFGQKIPPRLIEFPAFGFFNFHHSDNAWPSYPGPDPIRDMLADGKSQVFLNLHEVTDVLDGGALVGRSHAVELPPSANAVLVHRRTWPQMSGFIAEQVRTLILRNAAKWPQPRPELVILG